MSVMVAVVVGLAVLVAPGRPRSWPLPAPPPGQAATGSPLPCPVTLPVVADAVDLLALALRGGVGVVQALDAVAERCTAPVARQLQTVSAGLRWGVDDRQAWAVLPAAWQPAARALRMAASTGTAPADLLHRAADDMRRAEAQRLEVAASRLGVRVVLPLGLAFLPAFALTTVVPVVLALTHQILGR